MNLIKKKKKGEIGKEDLMKPDIPFGYQLWFDCGLLVALTMQLGNYLTLKCGDQMGVRN